MSVAALTCVLPCQQPGDDVVLRGRILDPSGKPVAGAIVEVMRCEADGFNCLDLVYDRETRIVSQRPTGRNGTFGLVVPRGLPCRLRIDVPPYAVELRKDLYGGENVEIRLRAGAAIEGRVVRTDGVPMVTALVRAWYGDHVQAFEGRTGKDGAFSFDRLMPGSITISVSPVEGAVPRWISIELIGGESGKCSIEVDAGATMVGHVTDAATGRPIAGAEIGVGWMFRKSVRSDADGHYVLHGLGGPYASGILVRADGYCKQQGKRPEQESGEFKRDFALQPGSSAKGRIVDIDGKPVMSCYVAVVGMTHDGHVQSTDWLSARTDEKGHFRINGLRDTLDHVIFVRRDGRATTVHALPPRGRAVPVDAGTIRLRPRRVLTGSVVDAGGAPQPGVAVKLRGCNADAYPRRRRGDQLSDFLYNCFAVRDARTDSLGRFWFGDLPGGVYSLTIGSGPTRETVGRIEVKPDEDPKPIEVHR